ncbi:hypothetical protein [Clostridium cochlearium]|uniref:hypothetical protein n=1 Tax=Clostridium cochlearium TaxID=1494 RepID=UPI00157095E5|nr:hypothetical protein [Clostridium cochlearium]MBV1819050.1 hypothetical protein [Bacteroidales bacterium MSK.15.36]MCG4580649.1 hypothetical protein [Clostridium cochlearium]NSJ91263.1 hypothetical protein [Coprococcus sp. MSK.21.13]
MTVLERLKIELNNKDYFENDTYIMYLQENNLDPTVEYNKNTMQRDLLLTVIDILEAVSNDVDLMRKVEDNTVGLGTTEAYKLLRQRIQDIKERIASIPISEESFSNVSLLFTRNR